MGIAWGIGRKSFNELRLGALVLRLGYDLGVFELNAKYLKKMFDSAAEVCIFLGNEHFLSAI